MSLTPYSDLFLRILSDDTYIQILRFSIMSVQNQKQVQNQIAQVDNAPVSNKQTAIASQPSATPVDASNTIPAIVNSPTVSIILAFAVLIRVILDRPSSKKK